MHSAKACKRPDLTPRRAQAQLSLLALGDTLVTIGHFLSCCASLTVAHPSLFHCHVSPFARAGEVQSWLDLCQQDATLRSYLDASGALQQLPTDIADLQPHQLDALRETVAVAQANKDVPGARPVRQGAGAQQKAVGAAGGNSNELGRQSESQEWLQDYTDMSTVSGIG